MTPPEAGGRSLSEAGALGGQPRRGRDQADEDALVDAELVDEGVELVFAGVWRPRAIEHVCDGQTCLLNAVVLVAERALRGEREVVRRDLQPKPATPVRKRVRRARRAGP